MDDKLWVEFSTSDREGLENLDTGLYADAVNKAQRIHRQKVLRRVRDLKVQARGHRIAKGVCLAKLVNPAGSKAPLDVSHIAIPATYED